MGTARLVRRVVDLTDRAVLGLDVEADEVDDARVCDTRPVRPDIGLNDPTPPLCVCVPPSLWSYPLGPSAIRRRRRPHDVATQAVVRRPNITARPTCGLVTRDFFNRQDRDPASQSLLRRVLARERQRSRPEPVEYRRDVMRTTATRRRIASWTGWPRSTRRSIARIDDARALLGSIFDTKVDWVSSDADPQYIDLEAVPGVVPRLRFQRVPDLKSAKNRLHLDLVIGDPDDRVRSDREAWGSPLCGGAVRGVRIHVDRHARSRREHTPVIPYLSRMTSRIEG
jgi:hypothetical protein